MALIGEVPSELAELYVLRFCVEPCKRGLVRSHRRFRALLDFVGIPWRPIPKTRFDRPVLDREPVEFLTSEHFATIQTNAAGFGGLFEWFPPWRSPTVDEIRLLRRTGLQLKFVARKICVYNSTVTMYN